jgi:hypothetical protein
MLLTFRGGPADVLQSFIDCREVQPEEIVQWFDDQSNHRRGIALMTITHFSFLHGE